MHHVASVYPSEIQLANVLTNGPPVTGVTVDVVDQMKAEHAKEHDGASKEATLALLSLNSATAASAIRALSNPHLDSAAPLSLNDALR